MRVGRWFGRTGLEDEAGTCREGSEEPRAECSWPYVCP